MRIIMAMIIRVGLKFASKSKFVSMVAEPSLEKTEPKKQDAATSRRIMAEIDRVRNMDCLSPSQVRRR